MADQPPFEITTPGLPDVQWQPISLTGTESLSQILRFDAVVSRHASDWGTLTKNLVGQDARIVLPNDGLPSGRAFSGIIERALLGPALVDGRQSYVLSIVARLALLGLRRQSRVFQDVTVEDVVRTVLTEHHVPHRFVLKRRCALREYCVQYQETDLELVERLLAEEGIAYFHSFDGSPTMLVVADDHDLLPRPPDLGALSVRAEHEGGDSDPRTMKVPTDELGNFRAAREIGPARTEIHEYDFRRPLLDLRSRSSPLADGTELEAATIASQGAFEVAMQGAKPLLSFNDHHSEFDAPEDARDKAQTWLEQLRSGRETIDAWSGCRRLAPGHVFNVRSELSPGVDGAYIVQSVEHIARASDDQAGSSAASYLCRVVAVPLGPWFRPPPPKKRTVQVVESAVVTGPLNEDIHTDEHGRIRIRFHWDVRGPRDDTSCFVRVATPWAGSGWGHQFIPRVGMEVLVSFVGGDPDRPVVVGALVNAAQPHPFPLPVAKTRSGIVTRSTPGGHGYNELSFDDAAGAEMVRIRSERDLNETVKNDHLSSVGNNRTRITTGDELVSTDGARTTRVGGQERLNLAADLDEQILGETRRHLHGTRFEHLESDDRREVWGSSELDVRGTVSLRSGGGLAVRVDDPSENGTAQLEVQGSIFIDAANEVSIRSGSRIRFIVGDSEIAIDSNGIRVSGKSVALAGSEKVELKGDGPAMTILDWSPDPTSLEEQWAQCFSEVFAGVNYNGLQSYALAGGGAGTAGWDVYVYSRCQSKVRSHTGYVFYGVRVPAIASWDQINEAPAEKAQNTEEKPFPFYPEITNEDPAVPMSAACQHLATFSLLTRGFRIEEQVRSGATFGLSAQPVQSYLKVLNWIWREDGGADIDACIAKGLSSGSSFTWHKWHRNCGRVVKISVAASTKLPGDTGYRLGAAVEADEGRIPAEVKKIEDRYPGSPRLIAGVTINGQPSGSHIANVLRCHKDKKRIQLFDASAGSYSKAPMDKDGDYGFIIGTDGCNGDAIAHAKDPTPWKSGTGVSAMRPNANGVGIAAAPPDLAAQIETLKRSRPVGLARYVLTVRATGEVLFVSKLLRTWGNDPSQNFWVTRYLWSLRNTPGFTTLQPWWLLFTPQKGLARAMWASGARAKRLDDLMAHYAANEATIASTTMKFGASGLRLKVNYMESLALTNTADIPNPGWAQIARRVKSKLQPTATNPHNTVLAAEGKSLPPTFSTPLPGLTDRANTIVPENVLNTLPWDSTYVASRIQGAADLATKLGDVYPLVGG